MSYTATATRGIAPTSINLNVFSHPPVKREYVENASLEQHLMHAGQASKPETPSAQLSDDEDIFNLDMVTMDMNFEQAYSMYTQIQQKNALSEVEQLQKVQQQGPRLAHPQPTMRREEPTFSGQMYQQQLQNQHVSSKDWDQTPRQYPGDHRPQSMASLPAHLQQHTLPQEIHNYASRHTSLPMMAPGPLLSPPGESIEAFGDIFAGQHGQLARDESDFLASEDADDTDQFFSTTESTALDKFLDNLAFSSEVNPLEFYHQNQPKIPHMFEMQTMGQQEHLGLPQKRELNRGFQFQQSQDLKSFGAGGANSQLRTPDTSVSQIQGKRDREDSVVSDASMKKRRKSTKPLLSLTQKRLNHSHSEQKRRLLCKEAYERCLRLVTNVDDYKNDLVSASTNSKSRKKSKRKQLNKDGLPNLSKHSALLKISNEIIKIQGKNEELRKLIARF